MSRHPYFYTHNPTVNYRHHPTTLHVIAIITNPRRYESRYRLFKEFQARMEKETGINLITVEAAYGHRPHFTTDDRSNLIWTENPPPTPPSRYNVEARADERVETQGWPENHVSFRTMDELWHKENLVNIGFSMLPQNWKYCAWVDADIEFVRSDWVRETVEKLQHHKVVQMFRNAIDLGPDGETFEKYDGFGWSFIEGKITKEVEGYERFHPGYAWAIRRDAYDALGGLVDFAVLGAGDRHMAYGLAGIMRDSLQHSLSSAYKNDLLQWEERATRHIKRDLGFVDGTILHYWHGRKADRKYSDRWKILIENAFNPRTDLKKDWQGMWQLEVWDERQMRLRDQIRQYFATRNEDSIDRL